MAEPLQIIVKLAQEAHHWAQRDLKYTIRLPTHMINSQGVQLNLQLGSYTSAQRLSSRHRSRRNSRLKGVCFAVLIETVLTTQIHILHTLFFSCFEVETRLWRAFETSSSPSLSEESSIELEGTVPFGLRLGETAGDFTGLVVAVEAICH